MRKTALLFLLAVVAGAAEARAQTSRHAAYVEIGGNAIVPSVNYERRLGERWHGRAGISFITGETSEDSESTFIFPFTVSSVNRPLSNHHFEWGGGLTFVTGDSQDLFETVDDDEKISNVLLTGILGYRYQKPDGGFQFRIAATPVLGDDLAAPWMGFSLGYAW